MTTAMLADLCSELQAEQAALDARLVGLDDAAWSIPTPATGWDVRDSVSHLCFYDQTALVALTDPPAFTRHTKTLGTILDGGGEPGGGEPGGAEPGGAPDVALGRSMSGPELIRRWRHAREATRAAALAAAEVDPKSRVPWYGPPMSLASFVTARLMETWAHGTDVGDALGYPPVASDRLRHVCLLGIKARPYAFMIHERTDPGDPVLFAVAAPDGSRWTWGPDDAADRVTGSALDLALVFTQRRHRADTDLAIEGPTAQTWMEIAQAFAGPAGPGREPLRPLGPSEPRSSGQTSSGRAS